MYIFNPHKTSRGSLLAHSHARLQRWAMILAGSPYTIEHLTGEQNVWADLLTRWAVPRTITATSAAAMAPIWIDWEDNWPETEEIIRAQKKHFDSRPKGLSKSSHCVSKQSWNAYLDPGCRSPTASTLVYSCTLWIRRSPWTCGDCQNAPQGISLVIGGRGCENIL